METKPEIIFENDNFLVVNKPAGMVTTKENRNEINTLEDYLRETSPNDLLRNGIMHRLDKGTSGLVLVAKTEVAFDSFKKQFKSRSLTKKYFCLVSGDVSQDGTINWPIGRSDYGFGKFGVKVDGKDSLTEFKLVKRYERLGKKYSLVEVNLKTGRTHQIRVHFSHLRWPLVGDKLYGGEMNGLDRPFLQAFYLKIKDPISGDDVDFKCELADDLKEHLKLYEEK